MPLSRGARKEITMKIETEWIKLTNNDSKVNIIINGETYYWITRALVKRTPVNPKGNRFILEDNFLINIIKRYTDVKVPDDDTDPKLFEKKLYEGKVALQKVFKSDYDTIIEISELLNSISDKMQDQKFNIDGPDPIES